MPTLLAAAYWQPKTTSGVGVHLVDRSYGH
jgi:hypothetical protein